jgi:type II secretory pathway component PulM
MDVRWGHERDARPSLRDVLAPRDTPGQRNTAWNRAWARLAPRDVHALLGSVTMLLMLLLVFLGLWTHGARRVYWHEAEHAAQAMCSPTEQNSAQILLTTLEAVGNATEHVVLVLVHTVSVYLLTLPCIVVTGNITAC